MKNPYENFHSDIEILISRRTAWGLIAIFLFIITLLPLYRNVFELVKFLDNRSEERNSSWIPAIEFFKPQSDKNILTHFSEFEKELESAAFANPPRRFIQTMLTHGPLREGNGKTRIGHEGWLFLQTALDSLTGYGPMKSESNSLSRDSRRPKWQSPDIAIKRFAKQLEQFGVELILVIIPVKPMIYPEHLGKPTDHPITHPDSKSFFTKLNALPNVKILDLTDPLFELKSQAQVFLKQDTHWTPEGMELAAKRIASHIKSKNWNYREHSFNPAHKENRESIGDLAEKLDTIGNMFNREIVTVTPIDGNTVDPNSPIILLGDSFTNIYSDSGGLNWGEGAGLAEHIAMNLRTPLDIIAVNGGGATEARKKLARRKGSATLMKNKRAVIWTITARDLFLSEKSAQKALVKWEHVKFDSRETTPASTALAKVRAKLLNKPIIPDPHSTTYSKLLYGAEYEVLEILSGRVEQDNGKIAVIHWAFKDRKLLPSANYEIGKERTLNLVPFDTMKELKTIEQHYDGELFDFYWDLPKTNNELQTKDEPDKQISLHSHLIASASCLLFAMILVLGISSVVNSEQH